MSYSKGRIAPGVFNDAFLFKVFIPSIFVRVFISVPLPYERLEIKPVPNLQLLFSHDTNNLLSCLGQVHNIACDAS